MERCVQQGTVGQQNSGWEIGGSGRGESVGAGEGGGE